MSSYFLHSAFLRLSSFTFGVEDYVELHTKEGRYWVEVNSRELPLFYVSANCE